MNDLILSVKHVSKQYILGQIGGTTLRDELQRVKARFLKMEDPTRQIGINNARVGEKFLALDNVSFDVRSGERIGIIGHNGAGKSTLLKLISRVTVPTTGMIGLNGRIASMLEVGTGFHPELTGRENIYMNGAILGMTKKEIDKKIEDIIDFSECRKFIDTPVKRYSSGMYVKLAFSVAAHLNSEIMIMDEVLAVGDMAFQKKCLEKMNGVSMSEGRTILYVSHNMKTIRQLCNRVIVLYQGKLVFDGEVEKGIAEYAGVGLNEKREFDLERERDLNDCTGIIQISKINLIDSDGAVIFGSKLYFQVSFLCKKKLDHLCFRFCIYLTDETPIATSVSEFVHVTEGKNTMIFELDISKLAPGKYILKVIAIEPDGRGHQIRHDCINRAIAFQVINNNDLHNFEWDAKWWGNYVIPDARVIE